MTGATPRNRQPQSSRARKPFQPAIGKEFDGVQEVEAKTRAYLAKLIASATVAGALIAGGYGLVTDNYIPVMGVWSVAGPIVGALVTYYFGPQRNDTG